MKLYVFTGVNKDKHLWKIHLLVIDPSFTFYYRQKAFNLPYKKLVKTLIIKDSFLKGNNETEWMPSLSGEFLCFLPKLFDTTFILAVTQIIMHSTAVMGMTDLSEIYMQY